MPRLSRVSFDYDETLTEEEVEKYANRLLDRGFDVWVVTSRPKEKKGDIYKLANKLDMNKEHIVFTTYEYKYPFIQDIDPIFHVDDDWIEHMLINAKTDSMSVKYGFNPDWIQECEESLIPYKNEFGQAKKPTKRGRDSQESEGSSEETQLT